MNYNIKKKINYYHSRDRLPKKTLLENFCKLLSSKNYNFSRQKQN